MSTTEWPLPSEVLIPSLPNDVALNILARLPRQHHAVLSAVSKPIRSAVSSPHFFADRSLLNRTEPVLYLRVRSFRHTHDHWFAVHRNPNPTTNNNNLLQLAPVPRIPVEKQLKGSAYAAVGPKIYVIGGYTDSEEEEPEPSSDVWILDCRSHTWERGPSILTPRFNPEAAEVGGKVYVVGSAAKELCVEVLDPAVGHWKAIPYPLDKSSCLVTSYMVELMRYKFHRQELRLRPTMKMSEVLRFEEKEKSSLFYTGCLMDRPWYDYHPREIFRRSDYGIDEWEELEGVKEGKPKYFCEPKLLNLEGRLVVLFGEARFGNTSELEKGKIGIWCAEIDVTKNGDVDWCGKTHWSEKVLLLPETTWGIPEESFDHSLFLYGCECLFVPL